MATGLTDKAEIVALSQVDTLDADERKKKVASLKRAAGRAPLLLSAVTGEGVEAVLRALMAVVGEARARRSGVASGRDALAEIADDGAVAEKIPAHHRQDRLGAAGRPHERA